MEHIRHNYYSDQVLCPETHTWEGFHSLTGDEEPAMELCSGCDELFDVTELAAVAA